MRSGVSSHYQEKNIVMRSEQSPTKDFAKAEFSD
jgi:hypothetical protein